MAPARREARRMMRNEDDESGIEHPGEPAKGCPPLFEIRALPPPRPIGGSSTSPRSSSTRWRAVPRSISWPASPWRTARPSGAARCPVSPTAAAFSSWLRRAGASSAPSSSRSRSSRTSRTGARSAKCSCFGRPPARHRPGLDTAQGSDGERLYRACGWTDFGIVPGYALSTDGTPEDVVFFYKRLTLPGGR